MRLEGVIVPLLTPVHGDESLDEPALERLIEHVLAGGVHGVFVLGSTGEFAALDDGMKLQVVRRTCEIVRGRVPVLAGVNQLGTRRTAEMARCCFDLGVSAVVGSAPFYYMHNQGELLRHFEALVRATEGPLVLYNIPQRVKLALAVDTVDRLARIDRVIGIKDSAGEMAMFEQFLALRKRHAHFRVSQGSERMAVQSLAAGADGLVLGQANVAPRLCRDLYDAGQRGDLVRAEALQTRLTQLAGIVRHNSGPAAMKSALHALGVCEPHVIAPFEPLSPGQADDVRATLRDLELL